MRYHHLHETLPTLSAPRVRAVIDTQALKDNYHGLLAPVRAVSPKTYAIAVVKADAYGHGIRPVVTALLRESCRSFAVACLEEGVALRRLLRELLGEDSDREADILILGYTQPDKAPLLSEYRIATALLSEAYANALSEAAEGAGVQVMGHIALDTGMNRIGFPAHNEEEMAQTHHAIRRLHARGSALPGRGLLLDGLFTHFALADGELEQEARSDSLTMTQYARYARVKALLEAEGIRLRVCHVCNSAAAVRLPGLLPEACLDAVRLGINLYGYGVRDTLKPAMRPVMRLETLVSHVHTLLPGESVGYGGEYAASTPRIIATLPVGYADGWIRALSGAEVTFHTPEGDVTAPIVGRICMDQCMVDVTDLPVTVGTPVTLFGREAMELEALAARAHTITYELLCLITARVPRVFDF